MNATISQETLIEAAFLKTVLILFLTFHCTHFNPFRKKSNSCVFALRYNLLAPTALLCL